MPRVHRNLDVMAPRGVLYGILSAAAALPGALLLAVAGQGLGAPLGGCAWIGFSVPLDRQVWALVNQPTINFASTPQALGYWLGSLALPLLAGYGSIRLFPRARSLAAELSIVHVAWGATVVAIAWLPLVDPVDGHLHRWLEFWRLPTVLIWTGPVLAAPAAFAPALRLLALLRMVRHRSRRGLRLAAVAVHFGIPVTAWLGLAIALRGDAPLPASLAVIVPVVVALAVAWFGYPAAYPHRLHELRSTSWLRPLVLAIIIATMVWLAGRPIGGNRSAGVLWASPQSTNNIRPWIAAMPILPGVSRTAPSTDSESTR